MSWSLKGWVFNTGRWMKHNTFVYQNEPKGVPHKNKFLAFSDSEMNLTNS